MFSGRHLSCSDLYSCLEYWNSRHFFQDSSTPALLDTAGELDQMFYKPLVEMHITAMIFFSGVGGYYARSERSHCS